MSMKNKIITLLIGMCLGGLLYGCVEKTQSVQAEDTKKFKVLFNEKVGGYNTYVMKDNEYNHEYIVVSFKNYYGGGIGIIERNTEGEEVK